jgi:cell division protein FtsQ
LREKNNKNAETSNEISGKYRRKTKKKRKRALKFVRNLLLTVLVIGTLVLLALSPVFNIKWIEVSGNKHYNVTEITEVSNIILGNNWFRMNGPDLKSILFFRSIETEDRIKESCPYVKKVVVRLGFPNGVLIKLTEREPVVVTPYDNSNLLLDQEGYILDLKEDLSGYNLPRVQGLTLDNCRLGQAVNGADKKKLDIFFMVLKEINNVDNDKIYDSSKSIYNLLDYVDVSDLDNIGISLEGRVRVNLGNYKKIGSYRLSFLREVFFNKLDKTDKGYLDFTNGDRPNFIPDK